MSGEDVTGAKSAPQKKKHQVLPGVWERIIFIVYLHCSCIFRASHAEAACVRIVIECRPNGESFRLDRWLGRWP
jgi:hypothetical protein